VRTTGLAGESGVVVAMQWSTKAQTTRRTVEDFAQDEIGW